MKLALIATLLTVITAAGAWWFSGVWLGIDDAEPLSGHGYVAMGLGIGFTVLVGAGLMMLVFFSSKHGYDNVDELDDA